MHKINYTQLKDSSKAINYALVKMIPDPNVAIETIVTEIQNCTNLAEYTGKK